MNSSQHIKRYPVTYAREAHIHKEKYATWYQQSIQDPEKFWAARAHEQVSWYKSWTTVHRGDFLHGDMKWFECGTLNVSYNCIDRHVESGHGEHIAIIWEGNEGDTIRVTYRQLQAEVSKLANVLKERGVQKGDRVCIYMPMIPEAAYAMLACARIGAVHSVVFGGFSSEALAARIQDASCVAVVTADIACRGDKTIPLKERVDEALKQCPTVHTNLVVRTTDKRALRQKIDVDYREAVAKASELCEPEEMQAEDPLFILYTSGSTGKPKGVLHTTGGYLVYASMTHKYVFDYHDGDIYWCTADVGWITGHSYIIYGPLCNRATTLMYEGVPTYPNASRYWEVIDKHQVNIFYSTPTALRMLMASGDEPVTSTSRKSLKVLGTVGEPINPEAWRWYHQVVGESRCPIVDTWWQTETGGIAITPLPGATELKPGSAVHPFFGIQPVIVDDDGKELHDEATGKLMLKGSWPGQMRDLYNDHARFMDVYFSAHPGLYLTGDGVRRDKDGSLWITGRIDDTMNISGHLIGTAEVESALVLHEHVAEAAVVTVPDKITSESMCAFVRLNAGTTGNAALQEELRTLVQREVGSFAKPKRLVFVPDLPKTRSGKIMRRIVRKIARGEYDDLGDVSTLAEPDVVEALVTQMRSSNG